MEDNLYHLHVELFKHQIYFLGNVAVQYFLIFPFYFSITFSYILLSISVNILSSYICLIIYYWFSTVFTLDYIRGSYC